MTIEPGRMPYALPMRTATNRESELTGRVFREAVHHPKDDALATAQVVALGGVVPAEEDSVKHRRVLVLHHRLRSRGLFRIGTRAALGEEMFLLLGVGGEHIVATLTMADAPVVADLGRNELCRGQGDVECGKSSWYEPRLSGAGMTGHLLGRFFPGRVLPMAKGQVRVSDDTTSHEHKHTPRRSRAYRLNQIRWSSGRHRLGSH